jgi:hypothetical protein
MLVQMRIPPCLLRSSDALRMTHSICLLVLAFASFDFGALAVFAPAVHTPRLQAVPHAAV